MLVITLGTPASGSTWAFNVARALFAQTRPMTMSLAAGDAAELLDNIPIGSRDIIVKAHYLDRALLNLASLFDARIIVTTRDARDSVVSQRERFGASLNDAVADLTRSYSSIAMLDPGISVLNLSYEERFMDKAETVADIARFLDLGVERGATDRIFKELRPEGVTRAIDRWLPKARQMDYDPASHWHAGHVGDGESGKWRKRLEPDAQRAVTGALGPHMSGDWRKRSFEWSSKLFQRRADRSTDDDMLECGGEECGLVWGPYLHLPTGRWRITPRIEGSASDQPISIRVDTFIPVTGREVVALRVVNLPVSSDDRMVMEFDHHNHLEPVEVRISSVADGRRGRIRFSGIELQWLGSSERMDTLRAMPVC